MSEPKKNGYCASRSGFSRTRQALPPLIRDRLPARPPVAETRDGNPLHPFGPGSARCMRSDQLDVEIGVEFAREVEDKPGFRIACPAWQGRGQHQHPWPRGGGQRPSGLPLDPLYISCVICSDTSPIRKIVSAEDSIKMVPSVSRPVVR